jgi:hypothetical protein
VRCALCLFCGLVNLKSSRNGCRGPPAPRPGRRPGPAQGLSVSSSHESSALRCTQPPCPRFQPCPHIPGFLLLLGRRFSRLHRRSFPGPGPGHAAAATQAGSGHTLAICPSLRWLRLPRPCLSVRSPGPRPPARRRPRRRPALRPSSPPFSLRAAARLPPLPVVVELEQGPGLPCQRAASPGPVAGRRRAGGPGVAPPPTASAARSDSATRRH